MNSPVPNCIFDTARKVGGRLFILSTFCFILPVLMYLLWALEGKFYDLFIIDSFSFTILLVITAGQLVFFAFMYSGFCPIFLRSIKKTDYVDYLTDAKLLESVRGVPKRVKGISLLSLMTTMVITLKAPYRELILIPLFIFAVLLFRVAFSCSVPCQTKNTLNR